MRIAVVLLGVNIGGCSLDRAGLDQTEAPTDTFADDVAALAESALDTSLDEITADASGVDEGVDTATAETTDATDTNTTDTKPEATPDTTPDVPDAAPPDPLYIECESGTLLGGMSSAADPTASGGKWASVPTTATPWSVGTGAPPTRVELPVNLPAGTWYVWVSMYTRDGSSDAMYAGFEGGPLRRFFSLDWNKFKWVGAEGSGARLEFTLAGGPTKLYVGAGEPGTGCDRVALTRVATWTPP